MEASLVAAFSSHIAAFPVLRIFTAESADRALSSRALISQVILMGLVPCGAGAFESVDRCVVDRT